MLRNLRTIIGTTSLLVLLYFITLTACSTNPNHDKSSSVDIKADTLKILDLVDNYNKGKETFKTECIICHATPSSKMTGQFAFSQLFDRLPKPSEEYFIKFILNSENLKSSGDIYAKRLAEVYNSKYEHIFQDVLSNKDLANLIIYIKTSIKER